MKLLEQKLILIPSYFDNTGAAAEVGTGFPTALFKPNGMPLLLSKIDRSSLSQYDIQNNNFVREIGDWVIPSQEDSETIIDVEYNSEFYLLGVSGHIYRGSNANNFTQIDQNIGFREARDIAIHPDGSLLVSDFQKKQIIQVSASEGTRLGIFADLRALNLGRPSSLVVTKNNFLLVTTKDDNKIHRFDVLNGEYLGVLVDGLGLNGPNKMLLIPSLQDRFHHDVNQSFSPNPGMWFSPESSGRGFDIGVFGNRLQVIWFTYDSDGSPIWYYSAGKVEGMNYQSPLYQTHKLQENDTTFEEVGYVTLAFDDERNASVNWQIGSIEGEEHLNWHFFDANYSEQNYTGMWTRTDSPGWGVSVTTQGNKTVALSFLYDDTGAPRWVNSSTSTDIDTLHFDVGTFFNDSLCPGCVNGNLEEVIVSGQMTFNFSEQPYWSSDMSWPMPLEGDWMLNQTPLARITSPPYRPR